jgi:hypothetical protein
LDFIENPTASFQFALAYVRLSVSGVPL